MPKLRKERDKETGRFLPGHSIGLRHAGYSSVSKDIPLSVRRQVQAIRDHLIRDIGGTEAALTAAQVILIDKTVSLYQVTLCLEAYVRANGAFRGKKLDPVLGQNYLAYVNTIRLNLRELGITKKAGDRILTPLEIAAEIDRDNAEQAAERARDTEESAVLRARAGRTAGGEAVSVDIEENAEEIARPGANGEAAGAGIGHSYPGSTSQPSLGEETGEGET